MHLLAKNVVNGKVKHTHTHAHLLKTFSLKKERLSVPNETHTSSLWLKGEKEKKKQFVIKRKTCIIVLPNSDTQLLFQKTNPGSFALLYGGAATARRTTQSGDEDG